MSEFNEIAGRGFLSDSNLFINSDAICCASPDEPPLPHVRSLPELSIIDNILDVAVSMDSRI